VTQTENNESTALAEGQASDVATISAELKGSEDDAFLCQVRQAWSLNVTIQEGEDKSSVKGVIIGEEDTAEEQLDLLKVLGLRDAKALHGFLNQILNASSNVEGADQTQMEFALSFIKDLKPQNHLEATLASQMAAAHIASMYAAGRFMRAENSKVRESNESAMNKLMRTFVAQTDALKRLRSKAQQVVRVERVEVSEGGQAIVGSVQHGGADK